MSSPAIRPRFDLFVDTSADVALARIEAHIEAAATIRGWVQRPYAELRVRADDRFSWSPRLAIHAEDTAGGTRLCCRMQPEPEIWTAYVALWSVLGVIAIGSTMYGISQWLLGTPPWVMAVGLPVAAILALALYLGALAGQRRGAGQMWLLQRELDAALEGTASPIIEGPIDDLPRARAFGARRT